MPERMKLFIPGPVNVKKSLREEMSKTMIGHRTEEFSEIFRSVQRGLKELMNTDKKIFISTSSSTGLMEGAVRNAGSPVLNLVNGAFGKRWHNISVKNSLEADALTFPKGKSVAPGLVENVLKEKDYSAVTLVHNETSTGLMNPLKDVAEVIPDETLLLVDTVSSMGGVDIDVDGLGLDVCLFGTQKCMGLPPGLAFCSLSKNALKRSESVNDKGYYFSYESFKKYFQRDQTITTPNISLLYALDKQLKYILEEEGKESRFSRHREMMEMVQDWAVEKGFEIFPEEGFESQTVTCIENSLEIDVDRLIKRLRGHELLISNGYGDLGGKTFRIAHMADKKREEMEELLKTINKILKDL